MTQTREIIHDNLKGLLLGPFNGEREILPLSPFDLYTTGIIYPQVSEPGTYQETEIPEDERVIVSQLPGFTSEEESERLAPRRSTDNGDNEEDELLLTTQFRPSSIGISAVIKCPVRLAATIKFGLYNESRSAEAKREDYHPKISDFFLNKDVKFIRASKVIECDIAVSEDGIPQITLKGEKSENLKAEGSTITYSEPANEREFRITFFIRNYSVEGDGNGLKILTASMINASRVESFHRQKNVKKSVFQPQITLTGEFQPYEDAADLDKYDNAEELNLKLLYRKYKRYALGHGVAADWNSDEAEFCRMVETSFIPAQKVNGMDFEPEVYQGTDVLFMKKLAGNAWSVDGLSREELKSGLEKFVLAYRLWIEKLERDLEKEFSGGELHSKLHSQALANISTCRRLLIRMEKGTDLLYRDENARKAFSEANRAMFMQRVMGAFAKERSRQGVLPGEQNKPLPDFKTIKYNDEQYTARWRPFQLAFLLSQVKATVDGNSEDRDTVDLIWFSTGGGKTEAYLGLTAFTIFYRRLKAKKETGSADNGAGVSVLMRYTLRLLNKQQFSRASILIMACDLIRRGNPADYGKKRISIGIWVGQSLTPNKTADNNSSLDKYIANINNGASNKVDYPPIFPSCPCCGTKLVRIREGNSVKGAFGYFHPKPATSPYRIACTNTLCDFYTTPAGYDPERIFPAYYVDDEVYENQPSLVFATVDKFAQIAWKTETMKLFNLRHGSDGLENDFPSPDLIIQDELHLISSSLGTVYGVFEMAIDRYASSGGQMPKIVAATATVKDAETQCRRLYARKNFMQFPPAGPDALRFLPD